MKGGMGQLGPGLAELFSKTYGNESVILTDIVKPNNEFLKRGTIL